MAPAFRDHALIASLPDPVDRPKRFGIQHDDAHARDNPFEGSPNRNCLLMLSRVMPTISLIPAGYAMVRPPGELVLVGQNDEGAGSRLAGSEE